MFSFKMGFNQDFKDRESEMKLAFHKKQTSKDIITKKIEKAEIKNAPVGGGLMDKMF